MTLSRREQIIQALAASVATLPGVTGVYRSRVEAFSRDESPALAIEAGQAIPTIQALCKLDWSFDVLVSAYARGAVPDTAADAVLTAAHGLLMADRTVGGLAINLTPGPVTTDLERADAASCWMTAVFTITFRTSIHDLTIP
jgi:hypothetical protein